MYCCSLTPKVTPGLSTVTEIVNRSIEIYIYYIEIYIYIYIEIYIYINPNSRKKKYERRSLLVSISLLGQKEQKENVFKLFKKVL